VLAAGWCRRFALPLRAVKFQGFPSRRLCERRIKSRCGGCASSFRRVQGQPLTAGSGALCKPGNGAGVTASGKAKAGFHLKNGPINALWLGGSGSAAVAPNSGTLRTKLRQ
jgi:hypothetical protein